MTTYRLAKRSAEREMTMYGGPVGVRQANNRTNFPVRDIVCRRCSLWSGRPDLDLAPLGHRRFGGSSFENSIDFRTNFEQRGIEEALGSSLSLGSRGVSKVVSELLSLWSFPAPRKNHMDIQLYFYIPLRIFITV